MYRVLYDKPYTKHITCSFSPNPYGNHMKRNLEIISFYKHRNLREFKGLNSQYNLVQ